ncbi:MAG: DNA topoisomerase 4 subunit A [Clostridiales bacterium]|nr:DNA topoisomerase 4 subunit A [Clostridiales bacterium]
MPEDNAHGIIQMSMAEVMHNSMIPYAEHVIMERAIPRVEDGLKPVQRRILFTMMELNLQPDRPHRKCARIVGDCLGKFHPHGDSSVYDALVRMAQGFSMREPLVDGHGNFGSIDGDTAAAMRYTEARMKPLALEMLRDIDKDTVPFRLNFDDTVKEPDMLPSRYPNLLVNGASGIAIGLATNIPPHNLRECIHAVVAQIGNPGITTEELMEIMPAPDFPTGGILLKTEELKTAYETGRGKLTLRARTHIEKGKNGRSLIVITEIPYQVNKSAMLEKILKISEERKAVFAGIYDIRDESDRTGMRAVIEIRSGYDAEKLLAALLKYTDMQVTFGVNMVAIAKGKPRLMSLHSAIRYYITHQRNVITARTQYELDRAKARAHILEGLMIAVDNLDAVIALIRASRTPKEAKQKLMESFDLDELQAQAILDMRLQRLTGLEIETLRQEYAEILEKIEYLSGILESEFKLMRLVKHELMEIAETYGSDRRTTVADPGHVVEAAVEEVHVAELATVTFSRAGYLRRIYPKFYRKLPPVSPENGNLDELPLWRFETDTDRTLYLFTSLGNCYQIGVDSLPESNKPSQKGSLLNGVILGIENNEIPVQMFCCTGDELAAMPDLLFVTKEGMLKRTSAQEYNINRQKYAAINLRGGDEVTAVFPLDPESDLLLLSRECMSIRCHCDKIPVQGRTTSGVKGMTLAKGDGIVFAAQPLPNDQILVMTDRGHAKRMLYMEFEPQARAGKGVKIFTFNKNGSSGSYLASALLIRALPLSVLVSQQSSTPSIVDAEEIPLRDKPNKGKASVMAVLDDVVTGMLPFIAEQPPVEDEADEPEEQAGLQPAEEEEEQEQLRLDDENA